MSDYVQRYWMGGTAQMWVVEAVDYDKLAAELAAAKRQDELHWRTRKSHLDHIATLESELAMQKEILARYHKLNLAAPETKSITQRMREAGFVGQMPIRSDRDDSESETRAEWGCSHTTNNGDRCVLPAGHGGNHSL